MQRKSNGKRLSTIGGPDEDGLQQHLARYSYNGSADRRLSVDARAVHEAVLAAIGTPSERSSSGDSTGSARSSMSSADNDEEEDGEDEDAADEEDEVEEEEEPNSSSSGDEKDSSNADADGSDDLEATLDDILGSPTADSRSHKSSSARRTSGDILTMGEQTTPDSPFRIFNAIAAKRLLHANTNSTADAESPDKMIQRLLGSSSSMSARLPATDAFGKSPLSIAKSSTLSSKDSSDMAAREQQQASLLQDVPSPGRRRSSSLTMIQELYRSRGQQQSSSTRRLHSSFADPNAFSSLNSTGVAPGSTTLSSPPSIASQMEFKKGRELGRGGFGVVFQAVLSDGRLAAVKQLPATDQKGIEKEMKIMCNLPPHPHCVQYLGTRKTKHHMYMVMEFVSGGNVHSLRQEMGKFSEAVARRYAQMTLLGLLHLHTHNIVHQDIKGGNVLLDERGCAKIADFGCIRELSYGTSQTGGCVSTQGGGGTPLWMAPEVCRGERASAKSDVWSFGCFVLEMVNGTGLPWSFPPGTSLQGAGYAIGSATHPPPFPEHLSDQAKDFLSQCLAIHAHQRASVHQLLRHPFLTNEPRSTCAVIPQEDFLRTVQSLASEVSARVEDDEFRLEAASDDDDDDDVGERPLIQAHQVHQGFNTARRAIDNGHVVWRSGGEMKIQLRQ